VRQGALKGEGGHLLAFKASIKFFFFKKNYQEVIKMTGISILFSEPNAKVASL
jgi:hypothetical protein